MIKTTEKKPVITHEPGYRAVLVREETKAQLQELRHTMPDRDINQERRLVSAAIEIMIERKDLHADWLQRVGDVVRRDIAQRQPSAA